MKNQEKEFTLLINLTTSYPIEKIQLWLTKGLMKVGTVVDMDIKEWNDGGISDTAASILQLLETEPLLISELQGRLGTVSKVQIWRSLKKLELRGLVKRKTVEGKRGGPQLWFTE